MKKYFRYFFFDLKADLLHSSLLLSGAFIAQIISVIAYPFLTRIYSPVEFGKFSIFLSITGLLAILSTGRLEFAIIIAEDKSDAQNLKKNSLWFCFVFCFACAIISLVSAYFPTIRQNTPGLFYIPLAVFLTGIIQIFSFYHNRFKNYKKIAQSSVLQNALSTGSKLILGMVHTGGTGLIAGSILGQLAGSVILAYKSTERYLFRRPLFVVSNWKKYSVFTKFRMPQAVMNYFSSNLPIFFFTYFFSITEAGYYALISGIALKIITLFSSSFYQVFFKRFTDIQISRRLRLFKKYILFLLLISFIPSLPIVIFSDKLIVILFGANWTTASVYFKLMYPWLLMVFVCTPFHFIPDLYYQQKKAITFEVLYLILRIISLAVGFILRDPLISVLLYSLAGFFYHLWLVQWYYRLNRKITD